MSLNKNRVKKRYYSVGEVSEMLGEPDSKLKHWEKELPYLAPSRSEGGTRRYTEENIEAFRTVQRMRAEGMTLEGIKNAMRRRRPQEASREQTLVRLRSALEKLEALEQLLSQ